MRIGGQIPWNAVAICEMSKTSWQMGKLHTKGVLENDLKAQYFFLDNCLSNFLFLHETSQGFTNLARIVARIFSDMY